MNLYSTLFSTEQEIELLNYLKQAARIHHGLIKKKEALKLAYECVNGLEVPFNRENKENFIHQSVILFYPELSIYQTPVFYTYLLSRKISK